MRLVATSMVALEVFFLKLKLFIHTGIAGGLFTLKQQAKEPFIERLSDGGERGI